MGRIRRSRRTSNRRIVYSVSSGPPREQVTGHAGAHFACQPAAPGLGERRGSHFLLPRDALEQTGVPALVMSAADDLFGTFDAARYTAEQIPRARFRGCQDR